METTHATTMVPRVDTHLAKFSQGTTFILSGLAFVLGQPALVVLTALLLLWSVVLPAYSPFKLIYQSVLVPLRLLRPRIVEDDPAPHRFAQAIGAIFLIASSILLYTTHAYVGGWTLDLIVFALSGLNFFVGFCAGCFVYYHLGRLGILPRVRYEGGFHWRGV